MMLRSFVPSKHDVSRVGITVEVNQRRVASKVLSRSIANEFLARAGCTGSVEHALAAVEWLLLVVRGPEHCGLDVMRKLVTAKSFVKVGVCAC